MNERIKELAKVAKEFATTKDAFGEYVVSFDGEKFEQKLAELIVRECAKLCREKGIFLANDRPNKDFDTIAFDCEAAIKQHFGVEE